MSSFSARETESKYIEILLVEMKGKTDVWSVVSKKHRSPLGTIKWFSRWRQYAFLPEKGTIFSWDCLKTISDFIKGQMEERKRK